MQNELARRLKDVVDVRFGGVARKASLAAGLNENAVLKVLENPHHQSTVETLDKMCAAYGWHLGDAVYWALNREAPPLLEGPAVEVVGKILAREGYSETDREFIRQVLERSIPARVPRTESQ